MRNTLVLSAISILFLFSGPTFAQTTWIVDQGGAGDFTAIQDCIDAAVDGDTCQVNPGTYAENIDFSGKNITVVIHRLLSEKAVPLTALGPHLPPELKDILSKAMSKDVTQRYQTCAELGQDLRKMLSRWRSGEE